jgi:hypothetical protein
VSAVNQDFLSARGRTALNRHQRQVTLCLRDVQSADRVVLGALTACDASGQRESIETYLEAVQELRVALERLEGFLLHYLSRRNDSDLLGSQLDAADA